MMDYKKIDAKDVAYLVSVLGRERVFTLEEILKTTNKILLRLKAVLYFKVFQI